MFLPEGFLWGTNIMETGTSQVGLPNFNSSKGRACSRPMAFEISVETKKKQ